MGKEKVRLVRVLTTKDEDGVSVCVCNPDCERLVGILCPEGGMVNCTNNNYNLGDIDNVPLSLDEVQRLTGTYL